MTPQDFESPLAYTGPNWQPRDTGGFFTLGQLYDSAPGGARARPEIGALPAPPSGGRGGLMGFLNRPAGGNVPEMFQGEKDQPSTNNWTLLPPPYNSPQFIMRNGHIIDMYSAGRRAHDWGWSAGAWLPGPFNNVGTVEGEYPISGRVNPEFGAPGSFRGGSFWPGQLEAARFHLGTSV